MFSQLQITVLVTLKNLRKLFSLKTKSSVKTYLKILFVIKHFHYHFDDSTHLLIS